MKTKVPSRSMRAQSASHDISHLAPHASRRVVGQWGGAGGANCEDHFALAGSVTVAADEKREKPVLLLLLFPRDATCSRLSILPFANGPKRSM